jgi:acyl dehydratase
MTPSPASPEAHGLERVRNRTFDELAIGDSASLERTLTQHDIQLFAILSGDVNPQHLDAEYAASTRTQGVVAHGMWGGTLISAVLGTRLPGPGTIYLGQTLRFLAPVRPGDHLTVRVEVKAKQPATRRVSLACRVSNQAGATADRTGAGRATRQAEALPLPQGFDLSGIAIEDVAHSHAAAARAVELACAGKVEALMKGSLHTDELMAAVVAHANRACAPSAGSATASCCRRRAIHDRSSSPTRRSTSRPTSCRRPTSCATRSTSHT